MSKRSTGEHTKNVKKSFREMSRRERRIAVCKDVILQLNKKNNALIAGHEGYINTKFRPATVEGGLQEHVSAMLKAGCTVCQRGSLLLSKARLFDKVPTELVFEMDCWDYNKVIEECSQEDTVDALKDVFTERQLDLMEAAYERSDDFHETLHGVPNLVDRAIAFGRQYSTAKDRMIAIMKNAIKNKGVFTP